VAVQTPLKLTRSCRVRTDGNKSTRPTRAGKISNRASYASRRLDATNSPAHC
jgi:hypothetical protein